MPLKSLRAGFTFQKLSHPCDTKNLDDYYYHSTIFLSYLFKLSLYTGVQHDARNNGADHQHDRVGDARRGGVFAVGARRTAQTACCTAEAARQLKRKNNNKINFNYVYQLKKKIGEYTDVSKNDLNVDDCSGMQCFP